MVRVQVIMVTLHLTAATRSLVGHLFFTCVCVCARARALVCVYVYLCMCVCVQADVLSPCQDSGISRSELYLASKVWTDKIYEGPKAVRDQVRR